MLAKILYIRELKRGTYSSLVGIRLGTALIGSSLAGRLRIRGSSRIIGIRVVSQARSELCRAEGLVGLWSGTAGICFCLTISASAKDRSIGQGRGQDDARGDAATHDG